MYEATGYWCDKPPCVALENVEIEPVKVVSVWHTCTEREQAAKFIEVLREVETLTEQKFVGFKATNAFYGIPLEKLKPLRQGT